MKIGDRLHDNDPRSMKRRVLTITAYGIRTERGLLSVRAEDKFGITRSYLVTRIHSDGKSRRSGFDLEVV